MTELDRELIEDLRYGGDITSEEAANRLEELANENERLHKALDKIADVNSAIEFPIRTVSYADWELRRIAREALEKKG